MSEADLPQASAPEPLPAGPTVRSRRRHRLVVAGAVALVVAAAALAVLRSPLFAARDITVEGHRRLSEQRVLRLAGISDGQNVITLDAGEARRRLEADPWIAAAEVTTSLPGTIAIHVTEREPVGAIETHAGWEVVAADGVVLLTPSKTPNLPTISAVVPGGDVATLGARLLGAMEPELRSRIGSLTVGVDGLVRLVLRDGVSVAYGDADHAVEKAQALVAVLAWAQEESARVQEIDVSVPGAPTARLAGGVVATP